MDLGGGFRSTVSPERTRDDLPQEQGIDINRAEPSGDDCKERVLLVFDAILRGSV